MAKIPFGADADFKGHDILNLGKDAKAIASLADYLAQQKSYLPATVSPTNQLVVNDDARFAAISGFIDFRNEKTLYSAQTLAQGGDPFQAYPLATGYSFVLSKNDDSVEFPDINLPFGNAGTKYLISFRIPITSQSSLPTKATIKRGGTTVGSVNQGEAIVIALQAGNASVLFKTIIAPETYTDAKAIAALGPSLLKKADLVGGKVPASQLPAYVDEIIDDYANLAALQAAVPTGSKGVIYILTDDDSEYRWTGSAYHLMRKSVGTTDDVAEGTTNFYFTAARAIGSLLTGYAKAVATRAITATDSVLAAIGILEAKADANTLAIQQLSGAMQGPIVQGFEQQTVVTITHGRGRPVFVQIYTSDGAQTFTDIFQVDLNTVRVTFSDPLSGNIIVL